MPDINKISKIALALAMPASIVLVYILYKQFSTSDEESYGKHKVVTTSKHTTIEVLVPKKAVGAVIGRQGVNIKEIQTTCGARLHFKDRQGNGESDRTLVIHGTAQSAQQAELMVLQTIADVPEVFKEEIQVPYFAVGRIIGKGGSTIRDIQRSSKCRIDIDRADSGRHQDAKKLITLVGSRKQIDLATEMIEEVVIEQQEWKEKEAKKDQQRKDKVEDSAGGPPMEGMAKWEKGSLKASAVPAESELWDVPEATGTAQGDAGRPNNKPMLLDDGFFELYVSAVEHPGHFWVQAISKEALQLERLQQEMSQWLDSDLVRKEMALQLPAVGELVAAKFEETDPTFYRAKVLGQLPDGKLDLYFVDYGDNASADPGTVYKLRPDFLGLSPQAIECHLANVEPKGDVWTDEGITAFEDLVYCAQWKSLVARVVTYKSISWKTEELRPSLHLFDTNGSKDIDINEELVWRGFARVAESPAADETSRSSQASNMATIS